VSFSILIRSPFFTQLNFQDIVLNDPKLESSLRRYFEYCTRETELITVKKPKFSYNLVTIESENQKTTKSHSTRKSQENVEFIPELEEMNNALQVKIFVVKITEQKTK
jgi:hypothetical protein